MIIKFNKKITFFTISAVLLLFFSLGLLLGVTNQNVSTNDSSTFSSYNSQSFNQNSIILDDLFNTNSILNNYQGVVPIDSNTFSSNEVLNVELNDVIPSYYSLRDYYAIYTKNQSSMGLCWAFTCNTVLESSLSIKYN